MSFTPHRFRWHRLTTPTLSVHLTSYDDTAVEVADASQSDAESLEAYAIESGCVVQPVVVMTDETVNAAWCRL